MRGVSTNSGQTLFTVMLNAIRAGAKKKVINAGHDQHELFEKLRKLRKELAEEKSVPPYVIFSDKSLHDMCQLLPRNSDEFLLVNGVGKSKLEKYGELFIRTING